MSETRIIKKYPNRRLYDTEISKYITLEDVKQLVLEGVDFRVMDVKTEEDLTRSILLQIIADQEHNGEPIFSTRTLTQLIRFYGNAYQSAFAEYLQNTLEIFAEQQKQFQRGLQKAATTNPLTTMQELAEKNLQIWQQLQDNFMKNSGFNYYQRKPDKDNED
ncbi:MAG: polyhydroxyalkanoate synthesis repressor PhaR [Gammaproteobacteria bacterium]|jgi:polyhydroxyalkanoate synthesis repressor PhaR